MLEVIGYCVGLAVGYTLAHIHISSKQKDNPFTIKSDVKPRKLSNQELKLKEYFDRNDEAIKKFHYSLNDLHDFQDTNRKTK